MDVLATSPRKKRALIDDSVTTPKRQRILTQQPTPATAKQTPSRRAASSLPSELGRLKELQNAIQHALSHALATSAVAPDHDTGRVPNVVNHVSLASSAGAMALSYVPSQDDVRRLCWFWEWDAKTLPTPKAPPKVSSPKPSKSRVIADEEENPFLSPKPATAAQQAQKDWFRGGMGFIVTATAHYNRAESRRVPAYGIGIEVDVAGEIDSGLGLGSGAGGGGMASVARWTAGGKARTALLQEKLDKWTQLHADAARVPLPPLADLPSLQTTLQAAKEETKRDKITKQLLSPSPGGTIRSKPPGLEAPGSPSRSSSASPTKRLFMSAGSSAGFGLGLGNRVASTPSRLNAKGKGKDDVFAIPFPPTPSDSVLGTPTADRRAERPETPTHDRPETPTHSRPETPTTGGRVTPVQTPQSTPRRNALYERIRQKSLSNETTPTAKRIISAPGTPGMTPSQMQALGQAELRRRSLLGRLAGVAESVWMFFSNTSVSATGASGANGLALGRKRRVMQMSEVVRAVIKSSPVPLSEVDAQQSLIMLTELCPFFLTRVVIAGEDWLEMPSSSSSASSSAQPPSSPGAATAEMRTRSPKSVRNEAGGLRQVRERIRRELDEAD
ncbi:hypothetical protein AURDEDRAFT_148745 [Auricularia subglabra TFB-10046 SS5]|nr:hypothetical protein AURDEDRAFT_148745 [Auricularia subglabra TFB-10046 SS5]